MQIALSVIWPGDQEFDCLLWHVLTTRVWHKTWQMSTTWCCLPQWAPKSAGPQRDGGAGEWEAPGQGCVSVGPINTLIILQMVTSIGSGRQGHCPAPRYRGSWAGGLVQIDCPAGGIVKQLRAVAPGLSGVPRRPIGLQDRGQEQGLQDWSTSQGSIPTGHPKRPHLCRNLYTRPLVLIIFVWTISYWPVRHSFQRTCMFLSF